LLTAADNGPAAFGRKIEAYQGMVGFKDGDGGFDVAVSFDEPFDLVIEHVVQAFDEDERQDVVFEFGGVLLAANIACTFPEHLLHGFVAKDGAARRAALAAAGLAAFGDPNLVSVTSD